MEWTVVRHDGRQDRVTADAWLTNDGDLVLYDKDTDTRQGMRVDTQTPVRAYARGVWVEVFAYA